MSAIEELIERLEKATGFDRDLDAEINVTIFSSGWPPNYHGSPTGNLGDAKELFPSCKIFDWLLSTHVDGFYAEIVIGIQKKKNLDKTTFQSYAKTDCGALASAALRSRVSDNKQGK